MDLREWLAAGAAIVGVVATVALFAYGAGRFSRLGIGRVEDRLVSNLRELLATEQSLRTECQDALAASDADRRQLRRDLEAARRRRQ